MDTPDIYYEMVNELPTHGEDLKRLRKNRILIDAEPLDKTGKKYLPLQLLTDSVIALVFFDINRGNGNEGFGEGKF